MVRSLFIIGIGGFITEAARFLISRYFRLNFTSVFTWGTFFVNIFGCLLIGIIYGFSERGDIVSSEFRLLLIVAICRGFTTFSTLSYNAFILLLREKEWMHILHFI